MTWPWILANSSDAHGPMGVGSAGLKLHGCVLKWGTLSLPYVWWFTPFVYQFCEPCTDKIVICSGASTFRQSCIQHRRVLSDRAQAKPTSAPMVNQSDILPFVELEGPPAGSVLPWHMLIPRICPNSCFHTRTSLEDPLRQGRVLRRCGSSGSHGMTLWHLVGQSRSRYAGTAVTDSSGACGSCFCVSAGPGCNSACLGVNAWIEIWARWYRISSAFVSFSVFTLLRKLIRFVIFISQSLLRDGLLKKQLAPRWKLFSETAGPTRRGY